MKHIGQLFLGLLFLCCCGVFAVPEDTADAVKEITEYLNKNNEDILKVYHQDGKWGNFKAEGKGTGNVYVLSHGVNDVYSADWLKQSAEAILAKDPTAQILSVNWDKYSNLITKTTTNDDGTETRQSVLLNPTASNWINGVAQLVSEELSSQNVTNVSAAVGHSYGAHVLAGVVKDMPSNTVAKLIALDPAEETLTNTGDQNGETTGIFSSDKQSKDWGITDKTITEVYKSSSFLGNDTPLGDYNYIIAKEDTFSPKSLLGDWGGFNPLAGSDSNHSLATQWFINQVNKSDSIGGWFNDDVTLDAGKGTWHGIVNTDTCTLDYAVKGSTDDWGEAVFEFAYTADDWSNTVLNTKDRDKFKENYPPRQEIIDQINQFVSDNSSQIDISALTGDNSTTTGGVETTTGGNGTTMGDGKSIGETLFDSIKDMAEETGNEIIHDAKESLKDAWDNIYNDLKDDFSIDNAIETISNNIPKAIEEIADNAVTKVGDFFKNLVSWETAEKLIEKGLDSLLAKYPKVKEVCSWFGLNNAKSIINLGKELFNDVKALINGESLIDVLKNSTCLINALKNGIKTGVNYLINKFITPLVNKVIGQVSQWLGKVLGGIFGKLGISISANDFAKWLTQLYQEGIKLVDKEIDKAISTIIGVSGDNNGKDSSTKVNKDNNQQLKIKDTKGASKD